MLLQPGGHAPGVSVVTCSVFASCWMCSLFAFTCGNAPACPRLDTGALSDLILLEDRLQQKMNDRTNTASSTVNMEDFFKTVGDVRSLIEKISRQGEEVEKRQSSILSSHSQDKGSKEELQLLNNETKKNAELVQAKLKSMQKNWSADQNSSVASVMHRIQRNQHSHLTRWFAEVMRGYHKGQMSFREKCKAQIQRQLEIVNKVTTDEELEEMLFHDNLTIFISDIKSEARLTSQALTEIERRHQDIICLESSIKELHEIFVDTAMLLEIQGELLNNIEKNVTSAAEYVDVSKQEINKAVTYKKNPHKIISLPSFFRPFKRGTSAKTGTDQDPSD